MLTLLLLTLAQAPAASVEPREIIGVQAVEAVTATTQPWQLASQDPQPAEHQPDADQKPDANQPAEKPPTPPHTGIRALLDGLRLDIVHLPSMPNLYLALLGGGAALAVHPFDDTFNARLRSHYTLVNTAFAPGKYVGGTPVQIAASIGVYTFGRVFDEPKTSHLGMDLLRAQAISELLVHEAGDPSSTP